MDKVDKLLKQIVLGDGTEMRDETQMATYNLCRKVQKLERDRISKEVEKLIMTNDNLGYKGILNDYHKDKNKVIRKILNIINKE